MKNKSDPMWHSDLPAQGSRRRGKYFECGHSVEILKSVAEPAFAKSPVRTSNIIFFLFSHSVFWGDLEGFSAVTARRLFCVYSSCMEHAHLVNCSMKSQSVTDWSEAPSQHCVCHKLGGGSTWWRLSRTNTNSRTFSGQQTEQQKQEAGLPGTKMLGLCSKINN